MLEKPLLTTGFPMLRYKNKCAYLVVLKNFRQGAFPVGESRVFEQEVKQQRLVLVEADIWGTVNNRVGNVVLTLNLQ